MYISSNVQAVAGAYAVNTASPARRASQGQPASASFRDEVHLSSEAQSFRGMLHDLKGMEDVRRDKVEFYTQAIEHGTYDVSAANIASRMLMSRF